MIKRYTGVCVGGLADGRTYAHDKPEMTVTPHRKLPDGSMQAMKGTTEYKFLLLYGDDIGVWVPDKTEIDAVIRRLTANYRPSGMLQKPLI